MPATKYCFIHGQLIREDKALVSINNRSFRYGDGCFETMKMIQGKIILFTKHMHRLFSSLQLLKFNIPNYLTPELLKEQIKLVATKNNHSKIARIRLTFFRGNGGLYDADNFFPYYCIQTFTLNDANNTLNENGLDIDVYKDAYKTTDVFANIKTNNFLGYAMAALWAKEQHLNDAIVCNSNGYIADTTIANIFILKKNTLFTPPLQDGCVNGIIRSTVLETNIPTFSIEEKQLLPIDLLGADGIFLTNSIYNFRWVKRFANTTYNNIMVMQQLYHQLIPALLNTGE